MQKDALRSELVIRVATVDDLQTIAAFNARLAEESEDTSLDRETLLQGVRALLSDRTHGAYFVACARDEIVGQIMHTREWSDWRHGDIWWIQSVYVHPDHRRKGVFRSLYRHLQALAESDPGVVGLRLYVERENHGAQATYANLGMTQAPYIVMQDLFGERK
jgi:ribosomal protein S18 acetylase RimI-like enzyme